MFLFDNIDSYDLLKHIRTFMLNLMNILLSVGFDPNSFSWIIILTNDHLHLELDELSLYEKSK